MIDQHNTIYTIGKQIEVDKSKYLKPSASTDKLKDVPEKSENTIKMRQSNS